MKSKLSELYLIGEGFQNGAARAKFISKHYDIESLISGKCEKVVSLKQYKGKIFCDILGTTDTLRLISSRLSNELSIRGITGLITCPVDLQDKHGVHITEYSVFGTTGKCGPIINNLSPKITQASRTGSGHIDVWLGYFFDEDSWDGSDIFRPSGTRMMIVTSRVKEIIDEIKATNIYLTPILEVERLVL